MYVATRFGTNAVDYWDHYQTGQPLNLLNKGDSAGTNKLGAISWAGAYQVHCPYLEFFWDTLTNANYTQFTALLGLNGGADYCGSAVAWNGAYAHTPGGSCSVSNFALALFIPAAASPCPWNTSLFNSAGSPVGTLTNFYFFYGGTFGPPATVFFTVDGSAVNTNAVVAVIGYNGQLYYNPSAPGTGGISNGTYEIFGESFGAPTNTPINAIAFDCVHGVSAFTNLTTACHAPTTIFTQ